MVTRPADQAEHVYRQLWELGAEVLSYPTIKTEPVEDEEHWPAVNTDYAGERWLVFTSENGVRYFLDQFISSVGDLRKLSCFKIASVGAGTSAALERYMLKADFMPAVSTTAELAREMVERLQPGGKRFIRVRGNLADNSVEDRVSEAGGEVVPLHVYSTEFCKWSRPALSKFLDYPPDYIIFTSGSTVRGFIDNLTSDQLKQIALRASVVSIGPMTTKRVESYGLTVGAEARVHNLPGTIDALLSLQAKRK